MQIELYKTGGLYLCHNQVIEKQEPHCNGVFKTIDEVREQCGCKIVKILRNEGYVRTPCTNKC